MHKEAEIDELVLQTAKALEGLGLSPQTVWHYYGHAYLPIARFHKQRETVLFDKCIANDYVRMIDGRFENNEISRSYYNDLRKAVERLTEFHDTGKLDWTCKTRVSKFKLNDYYEKILLDFLSSENFHSNTRSDFTWVVRKYLAYVGGNCETYNKNDRV